jgi:protein gp37
VAVSGIEWTDRVWNPVTGCDRVSPGCAHCYALTLAPRLRAMGNAKYIGARDGGPASGPAFGVTLHPKVLEQPLSWRKPSRVFVNSMSDLFHEEVPGEFVADVFAVMSMTPHLTYQVLTKRPARMHALLTLPAFWLAVNVRRMQFCVSVLPGSFGEWASGAKTLPNVWLGVSIENRRFVDRADVLRETPAAVRFISAEPLLGPLMEWMYCSTCTMEGATTACEECAGAESWPLQDGGLELHDIDWLIVGGESGPDHRPIKAAWVEDLRDLAAAHDTAFFFKQWGGRTPKAGGRDLDGRTWDEFPTEATA